jgi:putative oxidoreductase
MTEVIGRFTPQTFALLRIVSGLMFMMHGTQKILGWPPLGMKGALPTIAVVAGWIELVGGFLILIGLFTGIVAFLCSGEMAVAYFMGHAATGGMNPLVNKGELAALYCFIFLYIAAHGAGIWSVDNILRKRTPVTASTGAARV